MCIYRVCLRFPIEAHRFTHTLVYIELLRTGLSWSGFWGTCLATFAISRFSCVALRSAWRASKSLFQVQTTPFSALARQARLPLLWVRTMFFKSFAAARRSPAFFDARSSTYDLRFAEKECFLVVTMPVAELMLARNIAERGVHLNFFGFIFISTSRGRARQCRVQDGRSRKSS